MANNRKIVRSELFDRIEELQYLHDGVKSDPEEMFDEYFMNEFGRINSEIMSKIEELEETFIQGEMSYADPSD